MYANFSRDFVIETIDSFDGGARVWTLKCMCARERERERATESERERERARSGEKESAGEV